MGIKGLIFIIIIFIGFLMYHFPFLDVWYDKVKNFFENERKEKDE